MKNLLNTKTKPIDQFLYQNKLPILFFYHIIMFFLVFSLSLSRQSYQQFYKQHQLDLFSSIILQQDQSSQNQMKLSTMDELKKQLKFLQEFDDIQDKVFNKINSTDISYKMTVQYQQPLDENQNYKQYEYELDCKKQIIEPFDQNDSNSIRKFLKIIEYFQIHIKNINIYTDDSQNHWDLKIYYNPTGLNDIDIFLQYNLITQGNLNQSIKNKTTFRYFISYLLFFIISLLCLYQNFKEAYYTETQENINQTQGQTKLIYKIIKKQKKWNQLSMKYQSLIIDNYFIINLSGSLFQLLVSLLGLLNDSDSELFGFFLGASGFISCLNIMKYAQQNKNIQNVTKILQKSLPQLSRIILGFSPVFIGFSYLATCLFWRLDHFADIYQSMLTLLALMLGDAVLDTATLIAQESYFGTIFLITFQIIFIIGVHNVLISIICTKTQKIQDKESILKNKDEIAKLDQEVENCFLKKKQRLIQLLDKLQIQFENHINLQGIKNRKLIEYKNIQMKIYHNLLFNIKNRRNNM